MNGYIDLHNTFSLGRKNGDESKDEGEQEVKVGVKVKRLW